MFSGLEIPKTQQYGQQTFRCVAPCIWNSQSGSIRKSDYIRSFKASLKTQFFDCHQILLSLDVNIGSSCDDNVDNVYMYTCRFAYVHTYACVYSRKIVWMWFVPLLLCVVITYACLFISSSQFCGRATVGSIFVLFFFFAFACKAFVCIWHCEHSWFCVEFFVRYL